ncbi:MAG: cyclase family protein [Desulfobacterales bacterium]
MGGSIPKWPGSPGFELTWVDRIESGDDCNTSRLACDTHIGTHIDAPLHFVENGRTVDQIPLELLIGHCRVVFLPGITRIDAEMLASLQLADDTKRLLLKTDNSTLWTSQDKVFREHYACLTESGAQWLVQHGISLVGIDYLSIGSYRNGVKTHRILLQADVILLEGLDLSAVEAGEYDLICLPLRLVEAEGAPVRAVLREKT